jgi:hypothetical protein
MKNEKVNLIIIFAIFFLLSGTLFYLMLKKDINQNDLNRKVMQEPVDNGPDNVWPKVEIETRK